MDKEQIVQEMTLEEKVNLLQAKDAWTLNGVERFAIPELTLTDGPNGVRLTTSDATDVRKATALPTESILSASWDENLLEEIGRMLAEECHEFGVGILLGPGMNAKRSPLGGRNFEYYSEDPYLTGKLAAAMVRGVQANGIGTSLKHYVANDQETRRFTSDVTVDERTLREMLLAPFEIAIKEANPWTIMAAYPKLRGSHLCENEYVLKDILRDEYGYDGVVLSDWGGVADKVKSHKNGLDLETGSYESAHELISAVKQGEITEDELDMHVMRVLTLIEKVQVGSKEEKCDWDAHHKLARKAAAMSIVLLKNEDNILPLKKDSRIAVIGKFAKIPRIGGCGSSGVSPKELDITYDFISALCDAEYEAGYDNEVTIRNEQLIAEACKAAENKEAVIIFVGTTEVTESEGADRKNISLPQSHLELIRRVAEVNANVIVCNSSGSAVEFAPIENEAKAIIHTGLFGEGGGAALADIIFGNICPSGKLTETFPVCIENTPAYPEFPGYDDNIVYHEGLLQGYRYYDTKKIKPQYPFGHGLSYTRFEYGNLEFSTDKLHNQDTLTVTFDVTNAGAYKGSEIAQLYVSDPESYIPRPEKELKGFARVELEPGETKKIKMVLEDRAFAYYVPHLGRYAIESGRFKILIGASSADIRLQGELDYSSSDDVRLPLNMSSTLDEFYKDDRYADTVKKVYEAIHITEDHPLFLMLGGMKLEDLPGVLEYIQIPKEQGIAFQQMIKNAVSDNS